MNGITHSLTDMNKYASIIYDGNDTHHLSLSGSTSNTVHIFEKQIFLDENTIKKAYAHVLATSNSCVTRLNWTIKM